MAYDEVVVLGAQGSPTAANRSEALAPLTQDAPNIWAMKLRALAAAGRHGEARRSLRKISPEALERLPCDRDYLGTLADLGRAAIDLDEGDYLTAVKKLLAPYTEHFAIGVSFFCEGPVGGLLEAIGAAREKNRIADVERRTSAPSSL